MPAETPFRLTRTVSDADGICRFETEVLATSRNETTPFQFTELIPATSIGFRWTPGDFETDWHAAPRRRYLIVLSGGLEIEVGSGERRTFRRGDLLEVADLTGRGHRNRAADGEPIHLAAIACDEPAGASAAVPADPAPDREPLRFMRNVTGDDSKSHFIAGSMPYLFAEQGGHATEALPLKGIQFLLAPPALTYDWHPAPQRQVVLTLTGGLEVENGDGSRHAVEPGDVYVGEDTHGQGHITRSEAERFMVFAHLA